MKENCKEELDFEINNLNKQNLLTLIEYIKSSFDISVTIESEKQFSNLKESLNYKSNECFADDYEILLRKEESNNREHIGNQHQLKLYLESLLDKIDELEKENLILAKKLVYNLY